MKHWYNSPNGVHHRFSKIPVNSLKEQSNIFSLTTHPTHKKNIGDKLKVEKCLKLTVLNKIYFYYTNEIYGYKK